MSREALGRAILVVLCCACAQAILIGQATAGTGSIPHPPGSVDGRGYELVSQADKDANQLRWVSAPTDDGTRVLYDLYGGAPGSTGGQALLQANRTASGWTSRNMLPPRSSMFGEESNYVTSAATPDLNQTIETVFLTLGQPGFDPDERMVRLDGRGAGAVQQTLLHTFPVLFGGPAGALAASDDISHVYVDVPRDAGASAPDLDPSHQNGTRNVYDLGSSAPVLVSRMPGTNLAPACGVSQSVIDFADPSTEAANHWASTDGRRVFFQTSGDNCGDPVQLYMRDRSANGGAGATTLISGPPVGGDTDNGIDQFLSATPDGSKVFYRTATSLDSQDDADGDPNDLDIYRWDASTGQNVCITCAVPNADVSPAMSGAPNAVVSEDGSHVYFGSSMALAEAPGPAPFGDIAPNMYVWRDDGTAHGTIHFITTTFALSSQARAGGQVTPDGNVYIFRSPLAEMNSIPGVGGSNAAAATNDCQFSGATGGCFEYYRYDDRDGSVKCLSCPPGGATHDASFTLLRDVQPLPSHHRAVSDNGDVVVFPATDPLIPEDVNQAADLYEWHNGTIKLITDGVSVPAGRQAPQLISLTPNGSDVFFQTTASLTADAQDGAFKLYDARIGGGFAPPPPASKCEGDSCHPLPALTPRLDDPGNAVGSRNGSALVGSFSVHRVSAAARARFARSGRLPLVVRVNQAGTVSALARATLGGHGAVIARASHVARRAGTLTLTVRLSRAARRQLAGHGRLRIAISVRFSRALPDDRLVLVLRSAAGSR